jgi:hypothetical protein
MTLVSSMDGEKRNMYRILGRKSFRKRELGISRRRLVINIKIHLKQIGCDDRLD